MGQGSANCPKWTNAGQAAPHRTPAWWGRPRAATSFPTHWMCWTGRRTPLVSPALPGGQSGLDAVTPVSGRSPRPFGERRT